MPCGFCLLGLIASQRGAPRSIHIGLTAHYYGSLKMLIGEMKFSGMKVKIRNFWFSN